MANLKFSQFQEQTDPANVQFVVGYNGTDNVRIDPANLGGGATDLNGLSDVLIDGDSSYFVNIPAGLSGNPVGNIVIGSGAANSMTTATENVVIGVNALANDSGSSNANRNVIIGYAASQTSTSQVQGVVAIGWEASKANGNAFGGTHIGYRAADSTSSKYRSTSVGYNAHGGSAVAQDCVAIGYSASSSSTGTINGSTTVGFEAGSRSDAAQTTLIGYKASKDNQADGVVSLGYEAGLSQTSGTENTYLGWSAGYSVTTGSHNTVLGYEAGYGSLSGDSNTLIGASAGYSGSPNLLTGSNNIIIGHDASPSAFDANNEITLGNATNDLLRIPGLGNTDGHVLTYSATSGGIVLAAGGGGGDIIKIYRGSMYANQFSTTTYIYMPFTSSSESTNSNQDHAIVAPYDGYVSYIQIKNAATITPTASYIEMDIAKDTGTGNNPSFTSLYSTGNISVTTAMRMEADDTLTSTDATFSAGDLLYLRFKADGNWQRATFNMVVVYQP
jgi:hypothetical protein